MTQETSFKSATGETVALKSVHLNGNLEGLLLSTKVQQRYRNDTGKNLETVYTSGYCKREPYSHQKYSSASTASGGRDPPGSRSDRAIMATRANVNTNQSLVRRPGAGRTLLVRVARASASAALMRAGFSYQDRLRP
jgi:hypothetical protein